MNPNPFASVGRPGTKQHAKPAISCYSDTCSHTACLRIEEKADSHAVDPIAPYTSCLVHFVAQLDSNEQVLTRSVTILDNALLTHQNLMMNELWKEAITDVVMDMYALQKEEQETLRKDPLSILSLNRKSKSKQVNSMFNISTNKRSVDEEAEEEVQYDHRPGHMGIEIKKKKVGSSTISSSKEDNSSNPYARSSILGNRKLGDVSSSYDANKRKDKEREAEKTPCESCKSRDTIETQQGLMHSGAVENEVWGFKDRKAYTTVICRSCGHQATFEH